MPFRRNSPKADIYATGQEAVNLLKMLVAQSPPRSDTPKIKGEIEKIEKIFKMARETKDRSH